MKTGRTLDELAKEILRQKDAKRDFVADVPLLNLHSNGKSVLKIGEFAEMPLNSIAHEQLAERVGIPKKYYDRLREESPELLDQNVNHWFGASAFNAKKEKVEPPSYLVRTLDGNVRALLSDKYKIMDNHEVAEAVFPVLGALDLMILSCEITEKNMLIKAVDKSIERDIPTGARMGQGHVIFDTLAPAITIRTSEVGYGALSVLTSVFTKQCTNLATFSDRSVRKYHVGARRESIESTYELLSDKTKALTDAAMWSQIKDVVKAAFDRARFDALVEKIRPATEDKIEGDVVKVVEVTAKKLSLQESERSSVLTHLIQGGDLTRYGLFNAVTRTAEDLPDYDRATEFERFGGQIIELQPSEWREISQAV